jgi:hypothetical protein
MASGIGAALRGGSYFAARDAALQRLRAEDQPVGGREGYTEKEKLQMKMDLRKLQAMMQEKAAEIRADMSKTLVEKEKELLALKVAAVNQLGAITKQEIAGQTTVNLEKAAMKDAKVDKAVAAAADTVNLEALNAADKAGLLQLLVDAKILGPTDPQASIESVSPYAQNVNADTISVVLDKFDDKAAGSPQRVPLAALMTMMGLGEFHAEVERRMIENPGTTPEDSVQNAIENSGELGLDFMQNPTIRDRYISLTQAVLTSDAAARAAIMAHDEADKARQKTIDDLHAGGDSAVKRYLQDLIAGQDEPVDEQLAKLEKGLGMPKLDDLEAMVENLPSPEAPLTDAFSMKQRIMSSGRFQQEYAQQGTDLTQEQFFRKKTRELVAQGRERAIQKLTDQLNLGRIEAYRKKAAEPQSAREVRDAAAEAITAASTPTQRQEPSK